MKKWWLRPALAVCAAACCVYLSGCAAVDAVKEAWEQAGEQWSAESSEAVRRQEDLPETDAAQEGPQNSQEGPQNSQEGPQNSQEGPQNSQESPQSSQEVPGGAPGQESGAGPSEPVQEEYSFEEEGGHYAYDSLNETEQIWYRNINRILGRMQEKQELAETGIESGLDENHIDKIFQCVLGDHPEYFYVEGYTYTKFTRMDQLVKIEFSGTYSMSREEAAQRQSQIQAAAAPLLAGIDAGAGDYEKIKYVYETVIRNTDYDLNAPDNQNIYSVLVNRASVCQGYAKTVQYLLTRLGLECTVVMGTVDTGEGHAWNLVNSNGSYYYVDATWGDASYQIEESMDQDNAPSLPEINYDYLCVTTEQLLRTHTLGGVVPMPACVAMEDNYYVREGAYFTGYEPSRLESLFAAAKEQGREDITLKCADLKTYREMESRLIGEQEIFNYLDSPDGTVAYAQNEKQLSMTFWVTNEG